MIDLHIHTNYSDGDKNIPEILRICENKKLEYISITDHDTCEGYTDSNLYNSNIYNGKIITGCELATTFRGKIIEVLAYGIDIKTIND